MAKSYSLVAIDTDVLSCAYKDKSSHKNDQDLCAKIKYYLKTAKQNGVQIVMPTIVLAEFLFIYDKSEYDRVLFEIEQDYLLHDFDQLAAKELAELRKDKGVLDKNRQAAGATKSSVKFDQMIAAVSLKAGAKQILTGNGKDYASLTAGKLAVVDIRALRMPPLPQTSLLNLFEDDATQS